MHIVSRAPSAMEARRLGTKKDNLKNKKKAKENEPTAKKAKMAKAQLKRFLSQPVIRLAVEPMPCSHLRLACMCSGTGAAAWAMHDLVGDAFRHVMACEQNAHARRFLLDNHPKLEMLISNLHSREFELRSVGSDVAVAGFDCQPYSAQGQHRGLMDKRANSLWAIIAYLERHAPKVFVLENTLGLLRHHPGDFALILKELLAIQDASGEPMYDVQYSILNSRIQGGLPQNRERIYIVGRRFDAINIQNMRWPPKKTMQTVDRRIGSGRLRTNDR